MSTEHNHIAYKQRGRWLAIAAVLAGIISCVGTVAILVVATITSQHKFPDERATMWVASWAIPALGVAAGLSILGIILGVATRRHYGQFGVLGLLMAIFATMLLPVLTRKHEALLKTQCLANVKSIVTALQLYAEDYGYYTQSAAWSDQLRDYLQHDEVYRCPNAFGTCAYAYNATLDGLHADTLANPEEVVAIFESDRGWNAHGGAEMMTDFPRHLGGENVGFPDGHAKWRARQKPAGRISWDTKWPHEFVAPAPQWQPIRTSE